MNMIPHWGNCPQELKDLREQLALSQEQNVNYMRDLGDLTCKLRMATLQKTQCKDCPDKTQETIVENSKTVVE